MASKRLTALPDGLWTKLAELESHIRQLALVKGIGSTLAVAAICVGLGLLVDISLDLPTALRISLLVGACLATLITFFLLVWRPFWKQHADVDLAAAVERANPQLKESLISCIELYDDRIPESERGSQLMREMAARQALQLASPIDFCEAVPTRPAHRMATGALVAWALLLLPLIMPSSYRLLMARFFSPWLNHDRVASFWFDVEAGDRVVARGSDVAITAHLRGIEKNLPDTATLTWHDRNGETDSRRLDLDPESKTYATTIPHVMQGFQYALSGGGNRSRTYNIEVVDAPAITSFQLEVQPAAYSGYPAAILDGPGAQISVLEGSRLKWRLTFNKPMKSAELLWTTNDPQLVSAKDASKSGSNVQPAQSKEIAATEPDAEAIGFKLTANGMAATWESQPEQQGWFRFVIRDEHDLTNGIETTRHLLVVADQPPTLRLSSPASDVAQPSDVIPVEVHATDDLGVAGLELHYEVDQSRQGIVRCPEPQLGKPVVDYTFSMQLSNLHVKDGELVNYRVRAVDERPNPGPNETWSERFVIRIDSKAKPPGTQELAAEHDQLKEHLKQLRQATAENQLRVKTLREQAETAAKDSTQTDAESNQQRRDELEQATDLQEQLKSRLEQLAATFEQHPIFANLTAKTEELAEQEFSKAEAALDQAESAEPKDASKSLEEAELQLKQADPKLAALEQQLDHLAKLEQDLLELNRLAANADRLAERLRDLDTRKQQPAPSDETPQDQQRRKAIQEAEEKQLLTQQQDLARKADELLQRQPQLQQASLQNQFNQLAQLTKHAQKLAQPQRQLADQLQAAAESAPERNQELLERQQELKEQAEALNRQVAAVEPGAAPKPDPIDIEKLEKALESIKAGDLGAAAQAEADLAEQLEKLEKELAGESPEKAESKPNRAPNSEPAVTPPALASRIAEKLAKEQSAAAKEAQTQAEQGTAPDEQAASEALERLEKRRAELAQLPAEDANATKEAAQESLDQAIAKQEQLKQEIDAEEPKLETLQKENAVAQQKAAESLDQLAQELRQQSKPTSSGEELADATSTKKSQDEPQNGASDNANPDRANPEKQSTDEQASEKQASATPTGDKQPAGEQTQGSKSQKPNTEGETSQPDTGSPAADRPMSGTEAKSAQSQKPQSQKPQSQKPQAQKPQAQKPQSQKSGTAEAQDMQDAPSDAATQAENLATAAQDLKRELDQARQAQDPEAQKQQQAELAKALGEINQKLRETQERVNQMQEAEAARESAQAEQQQSKSGSPSARQPAKNAAGQSSSRKEAANKATPDQQSQTQSGSQPESQSSPGDASQNLKAQQQALQDAEQAMDQAVQQLEQGNLGESAKAGKQAADALEQLSNPGGTPEPSSSPNSELAEGQKSPMTPMNDANSKTSDPQAGQKPADDAQVGQASIPPETANQITDALDQFQQDLQNSTQPAAQPSGTPKGSDPQSKQAQSQPSESGKSPSGSKPEPASPKPADSTAEATAKDSPATPQASSESTAGSSPSSSPMPSDSTASDSNSDQSQAGTSKSEKMKSGAAKSGESNSSEQGSEGSKSGSKTPSAAKINQSSQAAMEDSDNASPSPGQSGENPAAKSPGAANGQGKPMPNGTSSNASGKKGEASAPATDSDANGQSSESNTPSDSSDAGNPMGRSVQGNPGSGASQKKPGGTQPAPSESGTGSQTTPSARPSSEGKSGGSGSTGQPEGKSGTAEAGKGHRPELPAGSSLSTAADRLQRASQALKQAAQRVQKPAKGSTGQAINMGPQSEPGGPTAPGGVAQATGRPDSGEDGTGEVPQAGQDPQSVLDAADLEDTDKQLQRLKRRMAGRKWGELPGKLQTEILQASQKKPNSEYGELIRQYFKEIAKSQPSPMSK